MSDSHLSSKHTNRAGFWEGSSFWCFPQVHIHASGGEILTHNSHASRLGFMVALQASSMRQSAYTPWSAGRGLSKQTAVSVVLNVLHVHVRKQKSVISKYK